jgi:phage/plasmid-like protein (TIGR03299 family)
MPAYFDTGFTVRTPAWHGLGAVLEDYPTGWDDARLKAGLAWEPELRPAYDVLEPVPCPACAAVPGKLHSEACLDFGLLVPCAPQVNIVPNIKLVRRDDTGAVLGSVTDSFELITHAEMGNIIEALQQEGGPALKFETAGSLKGGALTWCLVYLDEPREVAGDDTATYPFLALINAHDGSGACKAFYTDVRIVCWNTYSAASMQGERSGLQYTFRHTKGAKARVADMIEDARNALSGLRTEATAWDVLGAELAALPASDLAATCFAQEFIPEPEADVISPRVRANIITARARFMSLYEQSPSCDGHRGSALGLVDAAVEYLDHLRGFRNADTYMGRSILKPEPLKAKAVTLAREVCTLSVN